MFATDKFKPEALSSPEMRITGPKQPFGKDHKKYQKNTVFTRSK